jgi:hypothetical protein
MSQKIKGDDVPRVTPLETFPNRKKRAPSIHTISNKSPANVIIWGGALKVGLFEGIMTRTKNIKQQNII